LRRAATDLGVDRVTVLDDRRDELTRECGCILVPLLLGQVALEDGVGRSLAEIRLEDRRECKSATGSPAADAVSPRRHRPGR
jgi:hypothetical protein